MSQNILNQNNTYQNNTQPIAYTWDENKVYQSTYNCQLDQVKSKKTGENYYLLPANATWIKPPEKTSFNQLIIWNGSNWKIKTFKLKQS